ncbi:hypothetical protein HPB47_009926 [Ixodes persulcatus]|uniref:Uncharacterized protein n=1 Tax=Ixodes persulcatus TaxID=34615 RepID=A0AC60P0G4_IXOPE|nr:hypothetical protein HPB47_009926 [Ixodes persulcatus]
MSGHVGDLSDLQQQALDQLKDRIQDIWKEEFTDYFLLRWLRAREFDISKAESMLRQNQKWRRENNIDSLLETYKIPEALKPFIPGLLRCLTKEQMLMVSVAYLEQCAAEGRRQSEKLGRIVGTGTVLGDYEHLSLSQVCSLEVLEFMRKLIGVYESNYPETLERCFLVNTPSFFPYAWKLLLPFMSEKTAGKMQIFSYEGWKPVLFKYVDPSAIPVHWGGQLMGPGDDPECTHMLPLKDDL